MMWINKIIIKSFGGLKNVSLELEPGFTNLVWENEAGKSTIMAFIKMMFYGKVPGGNDISKNLRKKYLPWDESKMEGAIEFQVGDSSYRLEKSFGKTAAGDKVHLIHLNSGEEIKVSKDVELGQQFLDMDLGAFEKTIFIQNTGMISGSGDKDSVAEKISNLSNGMEEEVSMELVLKRLLTAKEELISKSEKTGELIRRKEKVEELLKERNHLLAKEEEQKEITASIEEKKQKSREKAEEIRRIKEILELQKNKELLQYSEEEETAIKNKEVYYKENLFVTQEHKERCQTLKEWIAKEEAIMETQVKNLQELKDQQEEKIKRKNEMQMDFDPEGEERKNKEMQQQRQRLAEIKEEETSLLEQEKQLDYESLLMEEHPEPGTLSGSKKTLEDGKTLGMNKNIDLGNYSQLEELRGKAESRKKDRENMVSNKKKCMILSAVLLLSGGILLAVSLVPGLIVLVFSALAFFFGSNLGTRIRNLETELKTFEDEIRSKEEEIILQKQRRKQDCEQKREELHRKKRKQVEEERDLNQKLQEGYQWLSKWQIKNEQILALDLELREWKEKINRLESENAIELEKIQKNKAELGSILGLYRVTEIKELEEKIRKQQLLEEEISGKKLKVDTIYAAFGMERMSIQELRNRIKEAESGYSKEQLEISKSRWEEHMDDLQREYEVLQREQNELYKKCQKLEQNPEDLEQRIQELKAENQDMEQYYEAVRIAYETMSETTQEIRQSFGPKLNGKTAEYFKKLTNDAYEDVLVQSDYGIMALKKGDISYHSYKYLSQGTIDQAYLALRLALIEIISEETAGQRLPLFLDDIFMQYDAPRRKSGVAFLKEYAKEGQVILFTPRPVE